MTKEKIFQLDQFGSYLRVRQPEGFEIKDERTGRISTGRFCYIRVLEETDVYFVEQNDLSIPIDEYKKDEIYAYCWNLQQDAPAFATEVDFGSVYCSAVAPEDTHNTEGNIGLCWRVYANDNSSAVEFGIDAINLGDSETEFLCLETYRGKTHYEVGAVNVFRSQTHFFLGSLANNTEISEGLYEALKSSTRAGKVVSEETSVFGRIESFRLVQLPTKEEVEKLIEEDRKRIEYIEANQDKNPLGDIPF
ncbi:hypothetical protein L4D76_13590 [Photobacterium sagamiensis]|uniref:hypothetical protein n=1 Tax=Photobacterium sagamiensis TaxID=2910241 RepID=UPI003D127851